MEGHGVVNVQGGNFSTNTAENNGGGMYAEVDGSSSEIAFHRTTLIGNLAGL